MTRQQHAQDRNHWDVHLATSFVDDDGNLIDPIDVTDRFNTRVVVRRFDTGTEQPTNIRSPISGSTASPLVMQSYSASRRPNTMRQCDTVS